MRRPVCSFFVEDAMRWVISFKDQNRLLLYILQDKVREARVKWFGHLRQWIDWTNDGSNFNFCV